MIIVIGGASGTGKSVLAVELAEKIGAEIINADASQVYKELDIGTAKLHKDEMRGIRHHVFDFIDPDDGYSVARYQKDARKAIEDIQSRGKHVIITGGTGLYIKAALYDFGFPAWDDEAKKDYSSMSNEDLYALLKSVDPSATEKIHMNNRRRVEQALLIYDKLGVSKTDYIAGQAHKLLYDAVFIAIDLPRADIYARSDARVVGMMKSGLMDEVRMLIGKYGTSPRSLQAIGYKEAVSFLNGEITEEQLIPLIQKNTRHYIKRQYAYFRHQLPIVFLPGYREAYNYVIDTIKDDQKQ